MEKEIKMVGIKVTMSSSLVEKASKDDLAKYMDRKVMSAVCRMLGNMPGYVADSEVRFVSMEHPEVERDGEIVVDTEVYDFVYELDVCQL